MAKLNIAQAPAPNQGKIQVTDTTSGATIIFDVMEITTDIGQKPIVWLGFYDANGSYVIGTPPPASP